jgi:hypothetical protein
MVSLGRPPQEKVTKLVSLVLDFPSSSYEFTSLSHVMRRLKTKTETKP